MSSVNIKESILRKKYVYILGGVVLLGGLLRLWRIGFSDFWLDEVVSIYMSKDFYAILKISYEPPFYFNILSVWIKLFGTGEGVVRSLSTFFDIGSICLLYICGKEIIDRKTGLLAAFIYSLAPFTIWYAREARNYSLSTFLVLLTVLFLIRALRSDKDIYWFLLCLSMVFNIYTTYITFVILPICVIIVLTLPNFRKHWKKAVAVLIVTLLAFIPYTIVFWRSFTGVAKIFWIPKPTLNVFRITLENFNLGYTIDTWGYITSHLFFTLPFIIGIVSLIKRKHIQAYVLMEFLFLPVLAIYVLSYWIPVYIDRKLLMFTPIYYLILAYGFTVLKPVLLRKIIMMSAIVLIFASLFGLYNGYINEDSSHHLGAFAKRPFTNVVDYVNSKFSKGDIVAHTNYSTPVPFHWYGTKVKGPLGDYFRKGMRSYFFYLSPNFNDYCFLNNIKADRVPDVALDVSNISNLMSLCPRGIWLLQTDWSRSGELDSNSEAVKWTISSKYKLVNEKSVDGILVSYYKCSEN